MAKCNVCHVGDFDKLCSGCILATYFPDPTTFKSMVEFYNKKLSLSPREIRDKFRLLESRGGSTFVKQFIPELLAEIPKFSKIWITVSKERDLAKSIYESRLSAEMELNRQFIVAMEKVNLQGNSSVSGEDQSLVLCPSDKILPFGIAGDTGIGNVGDKVLSPSDVLLPFDGNEGDIGPSPIDGQTLAGNFGLSSSENLLALVGDTGLGDETDQTMSFVNQLDLSSLREFEESIPVPLSVASPVLGGPASSSLREFEESIPVPLSVASPVLGGTASSASSLGGTVSSSESDNKIADPDYSPSDSGVSEKSSEE